MKTNPDLSLPIFVGAAEAQSSAVTPSTIVAGRGELAAEVETLTASQPSTVTTIPAAVLPLISISPLSNTFSGLPIEIIDYIHTLLDERSRFNLEHTAPFVRNIQWSGKKEETGHFFRLHGQLSSIVKKLAISPLEEETLKTNAPAILAKLFVAEDQKTLRQMITLTEKFFAYLSKPEIKNILVDIFSHHSNRLPHKFEQLAKLNLLLAINLITTLAPEELTTYGLSYELLSARINLADTQSFLEELHQASSENSAIHFALKNKKHYMALYLIQHAHDFINAFDINHLTPLMAVCSTDYGAAVVPLLNTLSRNHATIDLQDKEKHTALMHAVMNDQVTAVRFLLGKQANKALTNHADKTALALALEKREETLTDLQRNANDDIIRLLEM
jgi:hypothetical protein